MLAVVLFGPVVIGTGVAVAIAAVVSGASARGVVVVLGAALVVVGIWAVVRLPRVAVHLSDDTLRYSGFLVSWTAPRGEITAVLDDAHIEWREPSGARRRRQIWMLNQAWEDDGTRFASVWRWRREALLEVRDWALARTV